MSCCDDIELGCFVVGEKPAPLEYQFQDANGVPIPITGYAARFGYREHWGVPALVNASVTDPPSGMVTYTWDGTEFLTPGDYTGEFWVGNGTNRFASVPIHWIVRAARAGVPNI